MAEAERDGDDIVLRLSPYEAVVIQVLMGLAISGPDSDVEMYGHSNEIFWALEDHLHDPDAEDYWNRVYDSLDGDALNYSFTKETDG